MAIKNRLNLTIESSRPLTAAADGNMGRTSSRRITGQLGALAAGAVAVQDSPSAVKENEDGKAQDLSSGGL